MSRVIDRYTDRLMAHLVECQGKYYYVDTVHLFNHIPTEGTEMMCETMAFECDKDGNVFNWGKEELCHRYNAKEYMEWHDVVVHNLERFLTKEAEDECHN